MQDLFIRTDQPTTCPRCGARTEIIMELCNRDQTWLHECLSHACGFLFLEVNE